MRKRTLPIIKIALAFCLLCTISFAQKPKVTVYVSEQSNYLAALKTATMNVLVKSGKYEVVERSGVIDDELRKQASGAIDEDQMAAFGRQAGARYVCVSDMLSLGKNRNQVSARIIDVETAQLVGLGVIDKEILGGADMSAAITEAVEKMLGTIPDKINPNLPKKAVYVQGSERNNLNGKALYSYILEALFEKSVHKGNFVVVERSDAFTKQIDKELGKQRSGSVASSEISRIGKQYGIAEIFVANIDLVMDTYNINARLVNVERASVLNASEPSYLASSESKYNFRDIAEQMVEHIIQDTESATSFAQKPKVTVYISEQSNYSTDVKNALNTATMNVLARSGKYEVVERSGVIDDELRKQSSGSIDESQMVAFGRQAGARYVCVSDMLSLGKNRNQVSARIIDVETAQLVGLGVIDKEILGGTDMSAAIAEAVEKMLGTIPDKINPNLPKKAVYVEGGERNNLNGKALYTYTLEALFTRSIRNGDFIVVERSDAFTKQIDKELGKQRSGSVDNREISRIGKQYGIAEICLASIDRVMDSYNINARLVNVERASVLNASDLRSLASSEFIYNLRNIATQMVEDMIPKTAAELEEERQRIAEAEEAERQRIAELEEEERQRIAEAEEAERQRVAEAEEAAERQRRAAEEAYRTAEMFVWTFGGGVSWNINELNDNIKSLGGQFNTSIESYRRHLSFFRYGLNLDIGGFGYNKDLIEKEYPNYSDEYVLTSYLLKLNALLRLYPVDFLFLSGGIGWLWFGVDVGKKKDVVVYGEEPVTSSIGGAGLIFPVGGGICLCGENAGFVIEYLYNIVPYKGRTASYMSINFGVKLNSNVFEQNKTRKK